MGESVHLTGAAETARAFRAMCPALERDFLAELKVAGDFVRGDAAHRLGELGPGAFNVAAKYRARVRKKSGYLWVAVDNPFRKVTRNRPDWGPTQLRVALEPALEAKRAEIEETLEGAVFALADSYGF